MSLPAIYNVGVETSVTFAQFELESLLYTAACDTVAVLGHVTWNATSFTYVHSSRTSFYYVSGAGRWAIDRQHRAHSILQELPCGDDQQCGQQRDCQGGRGAGLCPSISVWTRQLLPTPPLLSHGRAQGKDRVSCIYLLPDNTACPSARRKVRSVHISPSCHVISQVLLLLLKHACSYNAVTAGILSA